VFVDLRSDKVTWGFGRGKRDAEVREISGAARRLLTASVNSFDQWFRSTASIDRISEKVQRQVTQQTCVNNLTLHAYGEVSDYGVVAIN
jgi:hypothetical protein